jgi:dihydrofolate synthase/folylpolyglutamate synthase
VNIDNLLEPFQRFGVHLGLQRIEKLLHSLGDPHLKIPIIHVAGTNGKGSVCAYLSSVLTEAGYKVGRYTSPHLIHWAERICIDESPITEELLKETILKIKAVINKAEETPTQFEVITAAAWAIFYQAEVDIAVIEVGLGGRLDATNVCPSPLVSIITSISRDHWQNLGDSLAAIAAEKAGIIKRGSPVVVGQLPEEAEKVVLKRIEDLNCPAIWVESAQELPQENQQQRWAKYGDITYPLPLWGEVQLVNSALAIAALQILQQQGWNIPLDAISKGMGKARWLGRLQWTTWGDRPILIDGAHNVASAQCLREYVDSLTRPITWIVGMLSTKDHQGIFGAILRSQDRLYLVPVSSHSTAPPEELAQLAPKICPELETIQVFDDLVGALDAALNSADTSQRLIVLCGSLYLVGYFLEKQLNQHSSKT